MSTWVVEDWSFWIWAPKCSECGRFIKNAEPVMHPMGGVQAVKGRCKTHGEVETHDFQIGDVEG